MTARGSTRKSRTDTTPRRRAASPATPDRTPGPTPDPRLERLRDEIERIDRDLVRLAAERVRHARAIGAIKRTAGLPTLDPAREAAVVRRAAAYARDAGIDAEDIRTIFWSLIGLCRRAQRQDGQP
ncbi:MAG TPA: chorismate mutase [Longimicrobiales bacterium]